METLRICLFGDGESLHIRRWIAWFVERGHEVHLVSLRPFGIGGAEAHLLPFEGRRGALHFPGKVRLVRDMVRKIRPDIVHGHQLLGYGLWAALAGARPLVLSAWGSDVLLEPERSWFSRRILRWMLPRADAVISVAAHLDERLRAMGVPASRSHVFPMGVDLRQWPLRRYRTTRRDRVVVSTRNLGPIYDVGTLIRALPRAREEAPGLSCIIFGEGAERRGLENLVASLGLTPCVEFRGFAGQGELLRELERCPVYVSTSLSDGSSSSLLEAMTQGSFPVVSDIPANREWIQDGQNGTLFPVRDAEKLANGIVHALRDEALLERASEINNRIVSERGDLDANLRRVEDLYDRLLRIGAPRQRAHSVVS